MLVQIGHALTGQRLQFGHRTNADHVRGILLIDPDRNARAPEAVAADVPVARLVQPVAEPLVADIIRHPMHGVVVAREPLVQILDADVPRLDGAVDQRRIGAVAERVAVHDRGLMNQLALLLEALDQILVAILAEAALIVRQLVRKLARGIERVSDDRESRLFADAEVVLAVRRRHVDQAGTVFGADETVVQHAERALIRAGRKVREKRFIGPPFQVAALKPRQHLVLLRFLVVGGEARLGHHETHAAGCIAHRHVVDLRSGADRQIFRQRPRRGGPDQQTRFAPGRIGAGQHLGAHRDRGILHILVVVAGLEIAERGAELPTVRHDAVGLIDAALLPQLLEDPPDALHERGIHGLVVVVEIHPASHARDGFAPLVDIGEHHRAALLVKRSHAELADFMRAADPQRLLRQRLDRQPVAIPAEAALHMTAAHGLVTRHDIFDRARQQMTVVRQAGRKGRTVIKHVIALLAVPGEALLECFVRLPKRQHFALHRGKIGLVRNRLKHDAPFFVNSRNCSRLPPQSERPIPKYSNSTLAGRNAELRTSKVAGQNNERKTAVTSGVGGWQEASRQKPQRRSRRDRPTRNHLLCALRACV